MAEPRDGSQIPADEPAEEVLAKPAALDSASGQRLSERATSLARSTAQEGKVSHGRFSLTGRTLVLKGRHRRQPIPTPALVEAIEQRPEAAERWDFRYRTRFSADALRAIRRMFDHWGTMLQTTLSPTIRLPVAAGVLEMDLMSYEAYTREAVDHGVVVILEASHFRGPLLLRLSEGLALALLDRELGGMGAVVPRDRAPSPLELDVLLSPIEVLVHGLQDVWRMGLPDLALKITRLEGLTQFQGAVSPGEAILWIKQSVTMGDNLTDGMLHCLIPYSSVEPVLPTLFTGQPQELKPGDHGSEVLDPTLGLRRVRIEAKLGPAVLSVGQLRKLREGDVIALPTKVGQGFWMMVEGRPAFLAHQIGRVGIRTAIRISQMLPARLKGVSHDEANALRAVETAEGGEHDPQSSGKATPRDSVNPIEGAAPGISQFGG